MQINIEKNLKNISPGYVISMGLLFLFVGLVISQQTRSQAEIETIKNAPSRQLESVTALLKESEEKKSKRQFWCSHGKWV